MFKTKKELDAHVRTSLAKLRSDTEKNLRSYAIAKLYYKINEFSTAEQYVTSYLTIKDDNDQAHRLLGQCYLRQKKPDKALASFQRSLQLNPKQPALLAEVCQLLIDDKSLNTNKAKYWCDLAESEKVQHDAVFSLRLKLMNKDNLETNQMEELIQKEIQSRPQDINLRVRLVRHFIEQNKILDAFQNTCHLEMVNHSMLAQSAEWYNVVWLVLTKYENMPNTKKDWQFWHLLITCLERQVNISFATNKNMPNGGTTETANLLFSFDQYLYKMSQLSDTLNQQKELVQRFMDHYQGLLCLHAASLIFKRELVQNKNKWKETIKSALPLLLLAYQSDIPDSKEPWMKHCDEHGKLLIQLWNKEGAFRCVQAGRTLFACIEENNENANQLNSMLGSPSPWTTPEALLNQIRQTCSDKNWRRAVFSQLFCNSDQKVKEHTSFLSKATKLSEPVYDLPTYAEVEQYEETAQYLSPQSLQHMVYLCLGNDNLAYVRSKFFNGLNFSTQNLSFCGAESLNQLDIETFLYASALQVKRLLEVERKTYDSFHAGSVAKPKVLPFVNIQSTLCTDEQMNWWTSAYQVYKNLACDNLAEIRASLQYGIEAVRGINGPKIDMMIVFKLGKIFEARAQDVMKPIEKSMLEARAENLYKYGLNMLKMNNKGVLEPFKRYFKYANANSSAVEREMSTLAEDAVSYLASRYFKKSEYEELIEELSGVQLPFATYLQSEAYRKLDEDNKTPKKAKRVYLDKASECLNQTLQLLKSTHVDPNHPLNSVIHSELKRIQQATSRFINDQARGNNSSSYEDAEAEFGIGDSPPIFNGNNRSRREVSIVSPRTVELENLVKQIAAMLTSVKEELVENIKPEVMDLKSEVSQLKEKLAVIEENMRKKSSPASRDDEASNVLDDLYIIENEFQNQMYSNQQQQQQQMHMYGSGSYPQQHTIAQRMSTPTTVNPGPLPVPPAAVNPYNSPLYGNYPMNYFAQQFMLPPQQGAAPVLGTPSQLANRMLPYMDSALNFNMAGLNPPPLLPTAPDARNINILGLLGQNQQQQLGTPISQLPVSQPTAFPSTSAPSVSMPQNPLLTQQPIPPPAPPTIAVPSPSNPITFNKMNNTPVEKGPPVNVVITSSDPLPVSNAGLQTQPTLSVTIPSHHIKSPLVTTSEQSNAPIVNTNFPMIAPTPTASSTSVFSIKFPTPSLVNTTAAATTSGTTLSFSFKPPPQTATNDNLNKSTESTTSLHKSETEIEYDPRPDFKPIIPLPDEVEVKTGEENEEVMFCSRSKLYRFVDKEWKERGVGDIKILKNNDNGTSRILMRRDQTHKVCANHRITNELKLIKAMNGEKEFIWAANDFADEELKLEKFLVRFKHVDIAQKFQAAFNVARDEDKETPKPVNGDVTNKPSPFGLAKPKSFADNKTSTPAGKVETTTAKPTITPTTQPTFASKSLFNAPAVKDTTTTKPQTASPFANFTFDKTASSTGNQPKPFTNIFASLNNIQAEPSPINTSQVSISESESKSDSDQDDDSETTSQFQSATHLPDLIETNAGDDGNASKSTPTPGTGFGDKFKPKPGSWSCDQCYTSNAADKLYCVACEAPKDATVPKKEQSPFSAIASSTAGAVKSTFTFGFGTGTNTTATKAFVANETAESAKQQSQFQAIQQTPAPTPAAPTLSGFGDKFKPKKGSWSCTECYLSNTGDTLYCKACDAPKDATVPRKEPENILTLSNPSQKFTFGFGTNATAPKSEAGSFSFGSTTTKSSVTTTPSTGFTFGIPKEGETASNKTANIFGTTGAALNLTTTKLGESKSFTFTPPVPAASEQPASTLSKPTFSFSLPSKLGETGANGPAAPIGSAFSLEKKEFKFVLKPKSPGKAKSPLKIAQSPGGAEEEEDEEVAEEEENNTYFTPVIALPDKVEIKTGEEDEDVMYVHRAKLYRYSEGEWKERGLGNVKILRHRQTKKLRIVMRREQVLKICLNHFLNEDVIYKNKDEKSWLFAVNDYSEGEVELIQFCLRFKNKEIADTFMKTAQDCLAGTAQPIEEDASERGTNDVTSTSNESNKDVQISDEEREIANSLSLPYSFFDPSTYTKCSGCRGCDPDSFVFPDYPAAAKDEDPLPLDLANLSLSKPNRSILKPSKLIDDPTPTKLSSPAVVASVNNSMFGNFNIQNYNSPVPSSNSSASTFSFTQALNSTEKSDEKPTIPSGGFLFGGPSGPALFGGVGNSNSVFGKPSIFGGTTATSLAPSTTVSTDPADKPKSIFSGSGSSVFGSITPKLEADSNASTTSANEEPKTIFGGSGTPLFSLGFKNSAALNTTPSESAADQQTDKPKTHFGGGLESKIDPKPVFGGGTIFGGQPSTDFSSKFIFGGATAAIKPTDSNTNSAVAPTTASKQGGGLFNIGAGAKPLFSSSDGLSFAALAKQSANAEDTKPKSVPPGGFIGLTHTNEFSSFKIASNPNANNDDSNSKQNDSTDADTVEHDPHFEPIIPLPAEIALSTGEEDEDKLFGERATLFRFDHVDKEWKERGIGEIKILKHKTKGTFRMVMRREQIHKLVLNHFIGEDFTFKPMSADQRSFIWATMNYAEEPNAEQLSVRLRNADTGIRFRDTLNKCIESAKSRAGIKHEND